MEDNLHEDKLDDYVRKSFEGYEENPAPDMWARIEGDLPIDAPAPLWRSFRQYRWQALAATVIFLLMSTLVCEHFYYQDKLRVLSQKHLPDALSEKSAPAAVREETNTTSSVFSKKEIAETSPASSPATAPTSTAAQEAFNHTGNTRSNQTFDQKAAKPLALPSSSSRFEEKSTISPASETGPESAVAALQAGSVPALASPEVPAEASDILQPRLVENEVLATPVSPIESPSKRPPAPNAFPVKPAKETNGWYVGLHTTPLVSIEQTYTPRSRPGRLAFANQKGSTDFSAIWWLRIGKENRKRPFSFETGIGYQTMQRSATHTPRFRFGDGSMQGGGPGGQRTFNYDLSTYGGTAEVSLRMEQTSPGTPSDEESVPLQITTTANAELLRIPLLATVNLGSGSLKARLKAGLLGNFFLRNELDISARVSENARFRPVDGQAGYTLQLATPGKFFLGYMASAGAEWRIGKKTGIVAELSTLGDFQRNDAASRPLPKHHSIGINLGTNFYF